MRKAVTSIPQSTEALNKKVREIIRNTKLNADDIMRNEGKLLVEELVDRTKPKVSRLKDRIKKTYQRVFVAQVEGAANISSDMRQQLYKAQASGRFKLNPRIALVKAALQGAIKKAQDHCGFFAAGWLGKGNPMGAKTHVPAYVARQDIQGQVVIVKKGDGIKIAGHNQVVFIKHFPKIREAEKRLLEAALATRLTKATKNLKRIISGKAVYRIPKP